MIEKVHLVTLYSMAVAIAPILFFLNSYVAKAEDVDRTNTQIMLEVQQIGVTNRINYNNIRMKFYNSSSEEKHLLKAERVMLMKQQADLDKMRQEIK